MKCVPFWLAYRNIPDCEVSESNSQEPLTRFYRQSRRLPVTPTLSSEENSEILKLLLTTPKSLIATTNPVAIQNNVTFVVDLNALEDSEDLLSDDLGAWEQTKTRSKCYKVTCKNGKVCNIRKVDDGLQGSHQVVRRSYVNRSDRSLHKTIVNVVLPGDEGDFNLVYVRYFFQGREEHEIEIKPHGNSKSSTIPYLRTYKSTVKKLEEAVEKRHACIKRVVHDVEESVGGLEHCKSAGALPRSERQASYVKASVNPNVTDPIFEITQKMKLEKEEKFIRCYSLDDASPKVILFTDDQVGDLVNFCCNDVSGHKSLLYVDVTFLLGPFYVLVTSYKNTTLFVQRSNPPVCPMMIGPIMLCMLKDKSTYLTLFQKLTAQVPGLKVYLQGYSTDSEFSLRQALAQEFPRSLSFLCSAHAQRNIKEKCFKLRLSQSLTGEIVADIFGSGGLLFAESQEEYNGQLDTLADKWDALEQAETGKSPQFSRYYRTYKSEDLFNHVSAKVSRDAGLEDRLQTNNLPESANALIKRWQDFEAKDMSSFVDDVKDLINKQRSDVKKAFLGLHSPYVVRPEYTTHVKPHQNVFDLSPGKRSVGAKVVVDPARYDEVHQYRPIAPIPLPKPQVDSVEELFSEDKVASSDMVEHAVPRRLFPEEDAESMCDTDSTVVESFTSGPQTPTPNQELETICSQELRGTFTVKDLKGLTAKAVQLVSEESIRKGFGPDSFFVKSSSSACPHTVKHIPQEKYVCDKECIGFNTRKMCSHVLAVAYYNNNLVEFLRRFKAEKSKVNLTAVTTLKVNSNAGRKQPPRRRARKKSPDTMTSMAKKTETLGDLLGDKQQYQVNYKTAGNPLRVTFRRKPNKPAVTPTSSTLFELIEITGRIRKCAGCFGDIKEGPGAKEDLDEQLCIRHKENDLLCGSTRCKPGKPRSIISIIMSHPTALAHAILVLILLQ